MCRSIKVLRRPDEPVTTEELSKAALQFVRKISGFHKPSRANQAAFEEAVREISNASARLMAAIAVQVVETPPCREVGSNPQLVANRAKTIMETAS